MRNCPVCQYDESLVATKGLWKCYICNSFFHTEELQERGRPAKSKKQRQNQAEKEECHHPCATPKGLQQPQTSQGKSKKQLKQEQKLARQTQRFQERKSKKKKNKGKGKPERFLVEIVEIGNGEL